METDKKNIVAVRSDGTKVIQTGNDNKGYRIGYMLFPDNTKTEIKLIDSLTKVGTFKFKPKDN